MSEDSEYKDHQKVIVIGDSNVGKSSILMRFKNDTFSEDIKNTVGIDHYSHEIDIGNQNIIKL